MAEEIVKNVPTLVGMVDVKHESDGEWFSHASEFADAGLYEIEGFATTLLDKNGNGLKRIKVSSRHTTAYERAEDNRTARILRMKANKRQRANRLLTEELTGKYCIQDWEMTDTSGVDVPFSRTLATAIMTQPEYRHHKFFAYACIMKLQGEIDEAVEEDAQD